MNRIDDFKDAPYIGYKNIKVKNNPNEAYFFLVKPNIS